MGYRYMSSIYFDFRGANNGTGILCAVCYEHKDWLYVVGEYGLDKEYTVCLCCKDKIASLWEHYYQMKDWHTLRQTTEYAHLHNLLDKCKLNTYISKDKNALDYPAQGFPTLQDLCFYKLTTAQTATYFAFQKHINQ